jgi:RNA polymerase sporulation-specific sigma factor
MGTNFVENSKNLTDDEVILLINGGEYEHFQIIIDRYLPTIVKTAKKYCPPNQVEDVVQEAIFALYSAVKGYDSQKATFATFANICIKRSIISILRKNNSKKAIPQELLLSIEEVQLPHLESPESLLIEREDYKAFTDNIKLELSNMEYKVLQLFLDGKTYSEIADIMDITEKSVDNALSRIRKKIKSGD